MKMKVRTDITRYSEALKLTVVEEIERGELNTREATRVYGIPYGGITLKRAVAGLQTAHERKITLSLRNLCDYPAHSLPGCHLKGRCRDLGAV